MTASKAVKSDDANQAGERLAPETNILLEALHRPISEIMEKSVVFVSPGTDLRSAMRLLLRNNVSGLPVIDANGRLVGIISQTDMIRDRYAHLSPENSSSILREDSVPVKDIMTPLVFALPESTPILQALTLMAYERIHRIPVVSGDNRMVGIVSPLDILRWIAALEEPSRGDSLQQT